MDAKKAILVVVVVFLGFWMVSDPSGLADMAKTGGSSAWNVTEDLFSAIIRFVGELS